MKCILNQFVQQIINKKRWIEWRISSWYYQHAYALGFGFVFFDLIYVEICVACSVTNCFHAGQNHVLRNYLMIYVFWSDLSFFFTILNVWAMGHEQGHEYAYDNDFFVWNRV